MSEPLPSPFHCPECGHLVHRAHARPDATWTVRAGVQLPMPDDVLIPTCGACGEWFVDGALAAVIRARLETSLAQSSADRKD